MVASWREKTCGLFHTCLKALQRRILTSSNADPAFTKNRFSNWKNAIKKKKELRKHAFCKSHMEAVARYFTAPATVIGDIGDLLSERHALEKSKNRKILLSILSNIRYLARQALPLRGGDWNTETKSEENSNFHQLLKLRAQENPEIIEWLRKRAWEIHIIRDSERASRGNGSWHDAANICKHSECDVFHDHGWRNSRCF